MFSPRCPLCDHSNPASAKFCNECAAPLHLKPCNECGAVTYSTAQSCYKCGTTFPQEPRAAPERRPWFRGSLVPGGSHSLSMPDSAGESPASKVSAASSPLSDVGLGHGRSAVAKPSADSFELPRGASAGETAGKQEHEAEIATRRPHSLSTHLPSLFSEPLRTNAVVQSHDLESAAGQRKMLRVSLSVVMLAAVAIAAYYVYHQALEATPLPSVGLPGANAPADANPGGTPSDPRPISVAPIASPPLDLGAASISTDQLATQPGEAAASPIAETRPVAEPRHQANRTAAKRGAATQLEANRPLTKSTAAAAPVTAKPPSDIPINVPRDPPLSGACTEAVAALGLCSMDRTGASK